MTTPIRFDRLTVLIVDDDEDIRKLLVEHLTSMGFINFIEAKDGADAYKIILDRLKRIDLVLCDWEMPKADGLTLLKAIRSSRDKAEVPFIMITSQHSQERMKITKAALGKVDAYIVKPFRFDVLYAKIVSVLSASIKKTS